MFRRRPQFSLRPSVLFAVLAVLIAASSALAGPATSAAASTGAATPGDVRSAGIAPFKLGPLEVTALQDGELTLDTALLKGIDSTEVDKVAGSHGPVTTTVNAFLVRYGKHLVLVDAGGTTQMAPGLGHLQERIRQTGTDPAAIEAVLITHMHLDHIGGLLTPEGKMAFPHARIRVAKAESDHWLDPATEAGLPEQYRPMIAAVKAVIAPYQAAGSFLPFAPGEEPFPGVTALSAPGHTPGHTVYGFGEGGNSFRAAGDLVHIGAVQFPRPDVSVVFDTDPAQAAASRMDVWRKAAEDGVVLGGTHIAFPGIGRIRAHEKGFVWEPLGR